MLEEINDIYIKCRENLIKHDIFQWDDHYPNRGYFQDCIENKTIAIKAIIDNPNQILRCQKARDKSVKDNGTIR